LFIFFALNLQEHSYIFTNSQVKKPSKSLLEVLSRAVIQYMLSSHSSAVIGRDAGATGAAGAAAPSALCWRGQRRQLCPLLIEIELFYQLSWASLVIVGVSKFLQCAVAFWTISSTRAIGTEYSTCWIINFSHESIFPPSVRARKAITFHCRSNRHA
jgi:hypothetical protein